MARLSVFLTTYNHAAYLPRSIGAIVNQSRRPDEFILQDDASTDNTLEVVKPFLEKYPFIKLFRNEKNLGPAPAMQKAAEYTTGDYIYGAGADDWVLPGFFQKAMQLLERFPQAGLCCGNPTANLGNPDQLRVTELQWSDAPRFISPVELAECIIGSAIEGHTTIMRRDAFFKAGGFIPELKWHADWFFNLVMAFRHGLCYIPESLAVSNSNQAGSYIYGQRDARQQAGVLAHALRLLKSARFRDVLPYFMRGSCFYYFSYDLVKMVTSNPEFWDPEIMLLMQHSLFLDNHRLNQIRNRRAQKR